jgi:magnesium chelatase subunit D
MSAPTFPLSAIVGQEALVEALLVNAVAPDVGGVLVRGERGTAKSTAVRALAPLLPHVAAAEGQPYAFAPGELAPGGRVPADAEVHDRAAALVELPLGATLDRLVGALDLGRAFAGEAAFEPGLLARAHRGILYVDEVNLLPDHLVDALLDAAASGVARVEREAVSVEHAARFVLVGTMNVEEGELRPQLLDRFGLGVEVRAPVEPAQRAEIVRRRLAFERDPRAFEERFRAADAALANRIAAAQELLPAVRLPERELLRIAGACAALGVDGVRGDIVSARAACALAALEGVEEVAEKHVRTAAALALAHRRRRDPLSGSEPDSDELERALSDADPGAGANRPHDGNEAEDDGDDDPDRGGPAGNGGRNAAHGNGHPPTPARDGAAGQSGGGPPASASGDHCASDHAMRGESCSDRSDPGPAAARERRDPPTPAGLPLNALRLASTGRGPAGRRAKTAGRGAGAIDSRAATRGDDIAVVATLQARLAGETGLRQHIRAGRESALICLVVDASGSMGARRRLARVKGALLTLLRDAYARRDRVAVVAFRADEARIVVAPGAPLEHAANAIRALPTGGRTPLAAGLDTAATLVARERLRERERRTLALVLTDGRVSDPDGAVRSAAARLGRAADAVHVIDTEDGRVRLGLAATLAAAAGGQVHRLTTEGRAA